MSEKHWIRPTLAILGVLIAVWAGVNVGKSVIAKVVAVVIMIAALIVHGSYSSLRKKS